MKRLLSLVLVVTMMASMLVGCGGNKNSDTAGTDDSSDKNIADTLVVAQSADPRGLDPALVDDGESSKIMCQIYEGLLKYDADSTEVLPSLAKKWEISEDGLEYIFYLEEGVKFHDGTDFNADAVKYNIDRQTVNKTEDMAYAGFVYEYVDSVEVVDEYTVKIILSEKCTPFLNNIAMSMSAPIVSPTALKENNNNVNECPVGTGPYKFVRWDKEESVVLVRNDEYRGTVAKTKNVIFKTIADASAKVVALTNGEVDIIDGIDANVVDQITSAGYTLNQTEGMNINYMAYNTEVLTDVEVRKALSQAINVEELVQSLYQGYSTSATSILPTFMAGYSDDVTQVTYDVDAAKATLKAKGITSVHMITYTNARNYNTATGQTLAEAIQGYFAKVGVTATIEQYDWTTYKEKVSAGDYDICFYGWIGDNGDADNFLNLLASEDPTMNCARYNNEEFNSLLAEAISIENGEERNAIYAQIEQLVSDQAVWLPISHAQLLSGQNPAVKDFSYHMTGNFWLKDTYKMK